MHPDGGPGVVDGAAGGPAAARPPRPGRARPASAAAPAGPRCDRPARAQRRPRRRAARRRRRPRPGPGASRRSCGPAGGPRRAKSPPASAGCSARRVVEVPERGEGQGPALRAARQVLLAERQVVRLVRARSPAGRPRGRSRRRPGPSVTSTSGLRPAMQAAEHLQDDPVVEDQRGVGLLGGHGPGQRRRLGAAAGDLEQDPGQLGVEHGVVEVRRRRAAPSTASSWPCRNSARSPTGRSPISSW